MKLQVNIRLSLFALMIMITACQSSSYLSENNLEKVEATQVSFNQQSLLGERLNKDATVTIWHNLNELEKEGYLDNFRVASGIKQGEYKGTKLGYADSEVYKFIEGASYLYSLTHNPDILFCMDSIINLIACVQRPNGHLQTQDASLGIDTVYSDNAWKTHRMYNAGHLYEGAVAHYSATGANTLLNIAVKNANMMCQIYNDTTRPLITPGHPEIELGLMKLYKLTSDRNYFELCKKLVNLRGGENDIGQGLHTLKHEPILQQTEAVGHAVRAAYLYSGITELAMETGDSKYINMLDSVWTNMVTKKTYITGGIGSFHMITENGKPRWWEGFGGNYELPNDSYCESCAAIANAIWNYQLFLLHNDVKYLDILERIIYNNGLSMLSMDGEKFYYQNELISSKTIPNNRKDWQGCCSNNILRFYPQIPGYMYAVKGNSVYINLFGESSADIVLPDNQIIIKQQTNYPWDGKIVFSFISQSREKVNMRIRVPGWAVNRPMYGDLYHFLNIATENISIQLNGKNLPVKIVNGFIELERIWNESDLLELDFPMPVRKVISNNQVVSNRLKVALQRGPVVYCVESPDNNDNTHDLVIPDTASFDFKFDEQILEGSYILEGMGTDKMGQSRLIRAIPYYIWGHRGDTEMDVWINRSEIN